MIQAGTCSPSVEPFGDVLGFGDDLEETRDWSGAGGLDVGLYGSMQACYCRVALHGEKANYAWSCGRDPVEGKNRLGLSCWA